MKDLQKQMIEKCGFELASNFDCPSEQIIGVYASRAGVSVKAFRKMLGIVCGACGVDHAYNQGACIEAR